MTLSVFFDGKEVGETYIKKIENLFICHSYSVSHFVKLYYYEIYSLKRYIKIFKKISINRLYYKGERSFDFKFWLGLSKKNFLNYRYE